MTALDPANLALKSYLAATWIHHVRIQVAKKGKKWIKKIEVGKVNNGIKLFFWLSFSVFFIYSFQSTMNFEGLANPYRQKAFIRILAALAKPNFYEGEISLQVAVEMWETIQTGFLATTLSAIFAIIFTFLSARPSSFWSRVFYILLQPILSTIRAIHPLIITFPAIVITGIGPTAGVLTLTLFSTAILIENFSEYAQQHTSLRWGILLKVYFPALAFKHLSVNILIATVLGFVGGSGIGSIIRMQINLLNYHGASVAILACIIAIGSLDLLSHAVWRKIQTHRELPETANLH